MNGLVSTNTDFNHIYKHAQRLAAAVFAVSSVIDNNEELKTKLKSLSIDIVSVSVNLKDLETLDIKKIFSEIEKKSLLLMSLLDIASLSGLISKMNGEIIKEEFNGFISGLKNFENSFNYEQKNSVETILKKHDIAEQGFGQSKILTHTDLQRVDSSVSSDNSKKPQKELMVSGRKESRKTAILDFIKDNSNSSIKDIVPNIIGCSEKTVQRELIQLINEGKIVKVGERRWSRYSLI